MRQIKNINDALAENARLKSVADKKVISATDLAEIEKYRAKVKELTIEEQKLKIQLKEAGNESKAFTLAQREQALANKKSKDEATALAGSYNEVKKKMAELRPLIQAANKDSEVLFQGRTLNFSQAIDEYKKLAAAEQDFRRQFTKDNLLVGEYTTGILQAFKSAGLDDLIKDQVARTKQQIKSLDDGFDSLKKELAELRVTGSGSFDAIERQMIENRNEANRLSGSLQSIDQQMRGMGGIGTRITTGIRQSFQDLKNDILRAGLAYLSFQGIVSAAQNVFAATIQLDSVDAAMRNTARSSEELAANQEFLIDTTKRLGIEYQSTAKSFNSFYTSYTLAGGTGKESREIYEAAAAAAQRLKLSQEDFNGVMLAFSQIASKGKVQAEELRGQIGERLPGAFSLAAKAMNVSEQQLNKMMETGQVMSKDFLPKFAEQLKNAFGGDTGEAVESLTATIARNKNVLTQAIKDNEANIKSLIVNLTKITGFLITLGSVILGLPIPWLIAGFTSMLLLTNTWIGSKLRLIAAWALENGAMLIENAQLAVNNGIKATATFVTGIYSAALITSATSSGIAAAAARLLAASIALVVSPIGLAIGLIVALTTVVGVYSAKAEGASAATKGLIQDQEKLASQQRVNADLTERIGKATEGQIARLNKLMAIARDERVSLDARKKALQALIDINPKYLQGLTLEGFATGANKQILDKYIESLKAAARQKAILAAIDAKEAEKARKEAELATKTAANTTYQYDAQGRVIGETTRAQGGFVDGAKSLMHNLFGLGKGSAIDELKTLRGELKGLDNDLANLYETANKEGVTKDAVNEFTTTTKTEDKDKKDPKAVASRLTAIQKDAFKDIEALRDEQLARLQISFNQQLITEEQYLIRSRDINIDAANKKLAILKGVNAEERKQQAELKLFILEQEQEANDKLYKIKADALTRNLDLQTELAVRERDRIDLNPLARDVDRLKAEEKFLQESLIRQQQYNAQMDAVERQYNQNSEKLAEDRKQKLDEINQQIYENAIRYRIALMKDEEELAQEAASKHEADLKAATAQRSIDVLNDPALSNMEKARKLKEIELDHTKVLLAQEIAAARIALQQKQKALEEGLATEKEVSQAKAKLKEAELAQARHAADTELSYVQKVVAGLRDAWSNITGIFRGQRASRDEINAAVKEGLGKINQAIGEAKENHFRALEDQATRERDAAIARLNLEQEQLLSVAQSEAEKESIRRQYDVRRQEEEKKEGERQKKIALQKAAIDFGLAVIKTLAQYPFPFSLIPVAGLTALYAIQRGNIRGQQFEHGGEVPKNDGGMIRGRSHAGGGVKFNYAYEAEGDEAFIINKRSMARNKRYSITGTPKQIASAVNQLGGGRSFFGGARVRYLEYGGRLGADLRPPQDLSFLNRTNIPDDSLRDSIYNQQRIIISQNAAIVEMNRKLNTLKVAVVASEVVDVDSNIKRATAVGNL